MSLFIYEFTPTFTLTLLALSFMFNIHHRSVSTFVIILVSAIVTNLDHYGYQEYSQLVIIISLAGLLIRAMTKPDNDRVFHPPYLGIEKRKKKRRGLWNGLNFL